MKRLVIISGIILLAIIIFAGVALVRFDKSPDELRARYGGDASSYLFLPSGAVAHYRDQGNREGPPLVLIHGSNSSLHAWEPWVERLGERFRLITVDMPGHGLTGTTPADDYSQEGMVAFLEEFTEGLNLEHFALGGNSMGGGISLLYALENPGAVTALVLVSSGGMPRTGEEDTPLVFRLASIPVIRDILSYILPRSLVEDGLKHSIEDDALVTGEMIDRYYDLSLYPGNRRATMARFASYADREPLDSRLGELRIPALILWGEKDNLIPVASAHAMKQALPDAELVIYNDIGHVAMEEIPDESAAAVQTFLLEQNLSGK
ncbi:MAG: alpha/beta hydrolase [Parvularculales bacterium]